MACTCLFVFIFQRTMFSVYLYVLRCTAKLSDIVYMVPTAPHQLQSRPTSPPSHLGKLPLEPKSKEKWTLRSGEEGETARAGGCSRLNPYSEGWCSKDKTSTTTMGGQQPPLLSTFGVRSMLRLTCISTTTSWSSYCASFVLWERKLRHRFLPIITSKCGVSNS